MIFICAFICAVVFWRGAVRALSVRGGSWRFLFVAAGFGGFCLWWRSAGFERSGARAGFVCGGGFCLWRRALARFWPAQGGDAWKVC